MASPGVHSLKSEEEEALPVWVLEDDDVCYRKIRRTIEFGPGRPTLREKLSVGEMIDKIIAETAKSKGCRLGQRSFSTSLDCNPMSSRCTEVFTPYVVLQEGR